MVLCPRVGKCTCSTLYEQNNPVGIQFLRAYTGVGLAETQTPGMLRKPGDLPYVCPRPKKFKRHATLDTLHGSRPNLRHRGLDGRIVPTPSGLSDKGASTKRHARRRKKMTNIREKLTNILVVYYMLPTTQLAKMIVDPKFVELTADVLETFFYKS